MDPTNMAITNVSWKPKMIRLTQIPIPDVDGGEPTPVHVNADAITAVYRRRGAFTRNGGVGDAFTPSREFFATVECTEVHCCHFVLLVQESPDRVAHLRHVALGLVEEKLEAVK